jgi:hypothetical protein
VGQISGFVHSVSVTTMTIDVTTMTIDVTTMTIELASRPYLAENRDDDAGLEVSGSNSPIRRSEGLARSTIARS